MHWLPKSWVLPCASCSLLPATVVRRSLRVFSSALSPGLFLCIATALAASSMQHPLLISCRRSQFRFTSFAHHKIASCSLTVLEVDGIEGGFLISCMSLAPHCALQHFASAALTQHFTAVLCGCVVRACVVCVCLMCGKLKLCAFSCSPKFPLFAVLL